MTWCFQNKVAVPHWRGALVCIVTAVLLLSGCTQGKMSARSEAVRGLDSPSPDVRRRSINEIVERQSGKQQPYLRQYAELAKNDSDELVRATAIRALNRAREASATPIFVEALDAQSTRIRLEAAKALANLPDERAIPRLVQLVNEDLQDKDVRIAAADALKHFRKVDVARALIAQLGGRDFGIAWQSRRSLMKLTGSDHRYDEAAWLAYIAGPDRPLG